MTKTEFYEKYGRYLESVSNDDAEYGDHLILHPEEIDLAKKYQQEGLSIVSVHETEDGEDFIDVSQPCDFGSQPFKYGYYAVNVSIRN
jgi:hypothetical protein